MEYVNKKAAKTPYWLILSLGLTFGILLLFVQAVLHIYLSINNLRYYLIRFVPFLFIMFVILRIIGDTGITGLKVDKYSRNKQYSKAESLLDKKIRSPLNKPFKRRKSKLLNMKALLYLRSGELKKSLRLSKKLLKEDPSFPKGWYLRAALKNKQGNMEDTFNCLKKTFNLYYDEHKIEKKIFEMLNDKSVEENFLEGIKQDEDLKDFVESDMFEKLKDTLNGGNSRE